MTERNVVDLAEKRAFPKTSSAGQHAAELENLIGNVESDWVKPAAVSPQIQAAALAQADEVKRLLTEPASEDSRRKWMAALATLTAASLPAEEAKTRIAAYLPGLDHPAGCFRQATLYRVAGKLKFFPAFGELKPLLDHEVWRLKAREIRLRKIADAAGPPKIEAPTVDADKLAELLRSLPTGPKRSYGVMKQDKPAEPYQMSQEEFEAKRAEVLAACEQAGMGGA